MLKRYRPMRHLQISEIFQQMEEGIAEDCCCEEFSMANEQSYARWALEPYSIGMKLRTLRTQKHLTLSRLAAETGLSTALLSKLETDRMIPTLPTLANICRVYGVGLSYFFADAAKHTLAITRKAHLIGNGRGQDAVKQVLLHSLNTDARLVARMIEYPPGAECVRCPKGDNPTCSVVYVLEGNLRWIPAECTRFWKRATAHMWTATWPLPGAREERSAVARLS